MEITRLGNFAILILIVLIAPAGILPRGKIPRRHPYSSLVYKVKRNKVLTVKIYSIYTRSNLNLPEQGAHGISG